MHTAVPVCTFVCEILVASCCSLVAPCVIINVPWTDVNALLLFACSSVHRGDLEGPRYVAEGVPFQVSLDRVREPHVPPERG